MKVALYARVSTNDKDQEPETQLVALRRYCDGMGWAVTGEYVDFAPARDLTHREQWRDLLDDAAAHKFQMILVFKLDRAFRSAKQMLDTIGMLDLCNIAFKSIREDFADTSTPMGRLMMTITAAIAEFELEVISDRVKAGMVRAREQGIRLGRPTVVSEEVESQFCTLLPTYQSGGLSKRQMAMQLGISRRTLNRMIDSYGQNGYSENEPVLATNDE